MRGEVTNNPDELVTNYPGLIDELHVGDRVMLVDGTVRLDVVERSIDWVACRVAQSGLIRNRQGVNLPGVKVSLPAMSDADRKHAVWAATNGADFVSLSFVRSPKEVLELKWLLTYHKSTAHVIAKIEKQEALDQLDEVVKAADGVMVARGDLGVEIDVARMPVVQKLIVATCNKYDRPVIIATQMLDSMQHSRQPTRAEVTDVANAILDGCDACMLSGETAVGEYPRSAVEMMHRVALATEPLFATRTSLPLPDRVARESETNHAGGGDRRGQYRPGAGCPADRSREPQRRDGAGTIEAFRHEVVGFVDVVECRAAPRAIPHRRSAQRDPHEQRCERRSARGGAEELSSWHIRRSTCSCRCA